MKMCQLSEMEMFISIYFGVQNTPNFVINLGQKNFAQRSGFIPNSLNLCAHGIVKTKKLIG